MTCTCNRQRMRLLGMPLACLLVSFPLTACAEIEVGAEVAKRISRAVDTSALAPTPTPQAQTAPTETPVQLAQATTNTDETLAISPFLRPAPNIFEATGLAVWDGKRTLQGVWVAHPLATSARRVRIFNESNGQAVDGALFKRDTSDSGASILISSEAAQLLGMDVGSPAELRIVAVSPVQRQAEPQATEQTAAAEETAKPVANETEQDTETTQAATVTEQTTEQPTAQTTTAPTPAKKPVTIEPAKPATQPGTPKAQPKAEAPVVATTGPAQTQTQTQPAEQSTLKLPYIQAGIFSVAGNAEKLIRRIESKDIPATGRKIKYRGKTATKVVAGPFMSTSERSAALRTIRNALGIKDATPVRR